jgi:hypothetical protein
MSTQVEERAPRLALAPRKKHPGFSLNAFEIIGLLVAIGALAAALFYYFTALGPEQSRLNGLERDLQRIQGELVAAPGAGGARGPNVRDTLASLQTFRSDFLKPLGAGRIALINQINALAKSHNVALTSGIDMPLQKGSATAESDKPEKIDKKGKKKDDVLAVFPRLDMHFTIFGQYANERAFVNDLEHDKQLLVVKSVGFALQEDKGEGGSRRGARAAASGSGLVMTIEASAYFQP